jgi:predicted small lipoprotein YifL
MRRLWLAVTLATALAASGCGQKGPLYLPDKNPKVVPAPVATPAEPATPQPPPAPKPTDKDQNPQPPPQ